MIHKRAQISLFFISLLILGITFWNYALINYSHLLPIKSENFGFVRQKLSQKKYFKKPIIASITSKKFIQEDFEINGQLKPPADPGVYLEYLSGKKKIKFNPSVNLCMSVVTLVQNEFVDQVNLDDLYEGAKEEVKTLLFDANLDYSTIESIPANSDIFKNTVNSYGKYLGEDLILYACLKGIMRGLNEHYSVFMNPDEFRNFILKTHRVDYVGIGIRISQEKSKLPIKIIEVFRNSPAEEAGIKKNDRIIKVNSLMVADMSFDKTVSNISGLCNTPINLSVNRGNKVFNFKLIRKKVYTPVLSSRLLKNNIGYIKVISFREDLQEDFKAHYTSLEKRGIKALILDLRDNPGGLVESAQELCSFFLPRQSVVASFCRRGNKKRELKTQGRQLVFVPTAVLVNERTASSSEITAGALKDHLAATIVGVSTKGKGTVQRTCPIREDCAIKLTIERIFTPKGNPIDKIGIKPHLFVEFNKEANSENRDIYIDKALIFLNRQIGCEESKLKEKRIFNDSSNVDEDFPIKEFERNLDV
jgi:carboxyl-terminal processing protease